MAHHKKVLKTSWPDVRVGREKKASHSKLTKGNHLPMGQNAHPKGKKPGTAWKLYYYPQERRRRKRRAVHKRCERKSFLKKQSRQAFREQNDLD